MRKRLLEGSHAYISGLKIFRKQYLNPQPFFHLLLCCDIKLLVSPALPLACTEEKGERYLRTLAVVKPA